MNPPRPDPATRRILFLATDLSTGGGVNRVIRDLAVLLKRRLPADVRVVSARSDRPSAYAFPADVPVELHRPRSITSYFMTLLRIRRTRPDVLISSWTQDNILAALAFAFSRTRVVLVEHSSWDFHPWPVRALRRLTYPLASDVIALNRADFEHYRGRFRRARLIPNPMSADPGPHTKREKMILAVGHLEPIKQFDHAIRAFAQSKLEEDGWSLEIVGSGGAYAGLSTQIASLGLKRASIRPPSGDLARDYARASILVVPSATESFSLVLAEAMQAGVLPIAYATNGPSFILEAFPEHLVPKSDVDGLAAKLADFASRANLGERREALRKSVEQRFSPEAVFDQWKELLS